MPGKISKEGPLFLDKYFVDKLMPGIRIWDEQIHGLLPSLPDDIAIHWFSGGSLLIKKLKEWAVAYDQHSINLVYNPEFKDKDNQLQNLKEVPIITKVSIWCRVM